MYFRRFERFAPELSRQSAPRVHRVRAGFTLLEMMVAGIVLTVVMTVSAQMLAGFSQQQRLSNRRQLAAAELANVMERITARPFADVTTENLQSLSVSDATGGRLPGADLQIKVSDQPGPPAGKRIRAEIRWRNRGGPRTASVRLTCWIFPRSGGKP